MSHLQRWLRLGRWLVTISLLVWVLVRADLGEVAVGLRQSRVGWLLIAVVLGTVNICVGSIRWWAVLRSLDVQVPLSSALRLCWSGHFFNTFVPSGVVGDALRGAWASRGGNGLRAAASVFLDRVSASFALAAAVGLGLWLEPGRNMAARAPLATAALVVGVVSAALLAFPRPIARAIAHLGLAAPTARLTVGPRLVAVSLALLTQSIIVVIGVALGRSTGLPLTFAASLAVIPAAMVTAYVPLSLSGIGVRDAALVVLLGQLGVDASRAVALSTLFLISTWAVGLIGGLVYLATVRRPVRNPDTRP